MADHLQTELERLDLLIHREILRMRAAYQLSLDEFRGLYISDQHVDRLIRQGVQADLGAEPAEMTRRAEALRRANAQALVEGSPWRRLRDAFQLSPFEIDVLLLALALEVNPKYETLYAYLNNDVTRKWPTCDLVLRLFAVSAQERAGLRKYLLPEAKLFGSGLLRPVPATPEHAAGLSMGFLAVPAVCRFLLEIPAQAGRVNEFLERVHPRADLSGVLVSAALRDQMSLVPRVLCECANRPPVQFIVLEGRYGMGAEETAEALCAQRGVRLLGFNVEAARASGEPLHKLAQALILEQRLEGAGLYLRECSSMFDAEGHPTAEGHALVSALAQGTGPVFFGCEPGTRWRELLRGWRKLAFVIDDPDYEERRQLWRRFAAGGEELVPAWMADDLASRFVLSPGQIRDAIEAAMDAHHLRGGAGGPLSLEELIEGARAQSDQSLGNLATRLRTVHTWNDLVLPPTTLQQVKEVAAAIRFRHLVYSQWGFDRRPSAGKGLKVLFSGAAGTGKTMTAGVIAGELDLDLYKIDLSGVVSKFIGETEKNLDRIFRAAHCGNAILFFDEADALFGKRSEVKDAHDRYANIEVAYLLQKMEDHDGVVILATNLSKNIDQAFARRMHYVVEFPLPGAPHRERLWRGMFPPQAPLAADVDFAFLAEQFSLAGGDIRNVVLSAAFLAAQNGCEITMRLLVRALSQQMVKQGRVPSATDFKQYHTWLTAGE